MVNERLRDALDALTPREVAKGHRLYQAHRFSGTDDGHILRLERWAEIPQGADVIDMGCGVGEMARIIGRSRRDINWTLVNISPAQLFYAEDIHRKLCADFHSVPLPDSSFDVALFCFSIGHGHAGLAVAEAYRLLRPRGVLFIYDMVRESGGNDTMADVFYTVNSREDMQRAADGFVLDWYMEPQDDGRHIQAIDNPKVFDGTKPAIWRFIKRG